MGAALRTRAVPMYRCADRYSRTACHTILGNIRERSCGAPLALGLPRASTRSLLGGHTGRFVPVFAHLASGLALPCLERAQAGAAAGNARKIGAKTALGRRLATTALLHAPHGAKRGSAKKTGAGMVSVHQCARRTAGAQRGVGPGRARKRGAKMEPSQLPVAPAVAVRRAQYRR